MTNMLIIKFECGSNVYNLCIYRQCTYLGISHVHSINIEYTEKDTYNHVCCTCTVLNKFRCMHESSYEQTLFVWVWFRTKENISSQQKL